MTDKNSVQSANVSADKKNDTLADSPIVPNTELEMILPWKVIEPAFRQVNKNLSKQIKLDGFRKGKVPPTIAAQYLSPERVVESTAEEVLKSTYPDFIAKSGKKPLGRPEFKIVDAPPGGDWKIQIHIAEKPQIELKDLDKELKRIRKERISDAKSRHDSVANAPKQMDENENATPKITKAPLDEATEKQLAEKKAVQEREQLLAFTYTQLILTFKPRIPELLVKQESEEQLHNLGHQLDRFKLSYDDYLRQRGLSEEQFMQEVTASALSRLQLAFLIDALIEQLHLSPDEKSIGDALKKESAEARKYYSENTDAQAAYHHRLAQRALEELLLAD